MFDAAAAQHPGCIRCGYDLRGLADDAACPECGLAVHRTTAAVVAGAALAELPPAWVARIARGAALVSVAFLSPFFSILLNLAGVLDKAWYIRPLFVLLMLAVHAAGAFLVTAREPGRRTAWRERGPAWLLRACALATFVASALFWYLMVSGRWQDTSATIAMQALIIACPALLMLRLQQLTRRMGRPRVAEHGAIAGCGLSGAAALAAVMAAVSNSRAHREWAVTITAGSMIAAAVFYVWCSWMLVMIACSLRGAAKQARATWLAADRAG